MEHRSSNGHGCTPQSGDIFRTGDSRKSLCAQCSCATDLSGSAIDDVRTKCRMRSTMQTASSIKNGVFGNVGCELGEKRLCRNELPLVTTSRLVVSDENEAAQRVPPFQSLSQLTLSRATPPSHRAASRTPLPRESGRAEKSFRCSFETAGRRSACGGTQALLAT